MLRKALCIALATIVWLAIGLSCGTLLGCGDGVRDIDPENAAPSQEEKDSGRLRADPSEK